jgi:intraflagellar transport protein 172
MIKSQFGKEIQKVDVSLGRYAYARTRETLLLADLETDSASEIPWNGSGREKFHFDTPGVCLIFNAGELSVVEYGCNEIVGSLRTEHMSPHLISVRIDNAHGKFTEPVKRIAYLLDLETIVILDLESGASCATITHDIKIDWLELNRRGTKLLFRDKRRVLHLYNVEKQTRSTLLPFCNYVQWVPDSDVVVAQNRQTVSVWYNIEQIDQVYSIQVKGEVEEIEREQGRTDIIVDEGVSRVHYSLDESLISFNTAVESGEYEGVVHVLSNSADNSPEAESMWKRISDLALEDNNFVVAERCFAALGDVSKARYIHELASESEAYQRETGRDGALSYRVKVKLALLMGSFRRAESILLDNGKVREAIEMYISLHKWNDAIVLAERRGYEGLEALRTKYINMLLESGQEGKAAELREREGDYMNAIHLYLKGGYPSRAATIVMTQGLTQDQALLEQISSSLNDHAQYEKVSQFIVFGEEHI